MVDGNSLYSFAARKANDLWPAANLHLGKFKLELRLVFGIQAGRPEALAASASAAYYYSQLGYYSKTFWLGCILHKLKAQ